MHTPLASMISIVVTTKVGFAAASVTAGGMARERAKSGPPTLWTQNRSRADNLWPRRAHLSDRALRRALYLLYTSLRLAWTRLDPSTAVAHFLETARAETSWAARLSPTGRREGAGHVCLPRHYDPVRKILLHSRVSCTSDHQNLIARPLSALQARDFATGAPKVK